MRCATDTPSDARREKNARQTQRRTRPQATDTTPKACHSKMRGSEMQTHGAVLLKESLFFERCATHDRNDPKATNDAQRTQGDARLTRLNGVCSLSPSLSYSLYIYYIYIVADSRGSLKQNQILFFHRSPPLVIHIGQSVREASANEHIETKPSKRQQSY